MKLSQLTKIMGLCLPLCLSTVGFAKENIVVPEQKFLVGTWTNTEGENNVFPSEGVYTVKLNKDGSLLPISELKIPHPSWIVLSKDHKFAYVTNETEKGNVTALKVNQDGTLTTINSVKSLGDHPTHATISKDGRYLLAANYSVEPNHAGVAVFPILKDGAIGEAVQNIPFIEGSGGVAERQKSGHAHSATFTPDGKVAYVADLGADVIRAYDYVPNQKAPLKANPALDMKFSHGSGPRHLLFSHDGQFAYVTTEMNAQVTVLKKEAGQYKAIQSENLAARDHEDHKSAAGLIFSPDQKFLYVGNRKKVNEIVTYAVNDGKLTLVGRYSSGGVEPRAFAIDASGEYLIVSNVFTHTVSEFKRNKTTGALTPTRVALQIGQPTDIKFLP